MLLAACRHEEAVDPLLRSRADGLNREAFLNRYRSPGRCLQLADSALRFIADSLPEYGDGVLRALNNKAFAYFQTTRYPEALAVVERIERCVVCSGECVVGSTGSNATHYPLSTTHSPNADIELMIARLLKARLLQRSCRIADSYRILYDVERSHVLRRNRGNLLYDYALSEWYITSLVLNFHYRDGRQADVTTLLEEVEAVRPSLQVDYAQDMALNYALAYGWQSAGESLVALDYCDMNLDLLARPDAFCNYQYANTLQMMALALKSIPGSVPPDSVLALYDEARRRFADYGDPYQMLGGVTSTARYAMLIGDTLHARQVLTEWRALRGTWKPFAAPKMELGYFDVLLRSGLASSTAEALRWYEHYVELSDHIKKNEKEDFELQQTLAAATRRSRWTTRTAMVVSVLLVLLLVLTVQLWISTRRLRREKRQIEAANRRDVERIANVETALSVMRHDISPFIGYLSNPQLPAELRGEVVQQLVRTFDNIKRWTNLSIPAGMAFNATVFPLQEVFDEVCRQVPNPADGVTLRFQPTSLRLWADRNLVAILLRNLVGNALKHTTEGSVRVESAERRVESGEPFVEITVSDTGSGMSAEQQESLFRADRTMPAGAEHGFGLILCRYIVRRHDDNTRRGCRIWVESTPGEGTTMHCLLAGEKMKLKIEN